MSGETASRTQLQLFARRANPPDLRNDSPKATSILPGLASNGNLGDEAEAISQTMRIGAIDGI